MPRELHLCALLHFVLVFLTLDRDQLVHLEHGLRELIEVATSDDIDLRACEADLNSLEIVREVSQSLHCIGGDTLSLGVVDEESL